MYLYWQPPITRWDDTSLVLRVIEDTPDGSQLVFWGQGISFFDTANVLRGECHFGIQSGPKPGTAKRINWGGYDRDPAFGGGNGAIFRGSISTLPASSTPNSPFYDWQVGEDYYLRVFKSPKQNYLAAELSAGTLTGNQQAGEVAWRMTILRVSTGVETFVRDLLVGNCRVAGAAGVPTAFVEDFNQSPQPIRSNDARWSELRVDKRLAPQADAEYTGAGTYTTTNVFLDAVGFRTKTNTPRTTPALTRLTHPGPVLRSHASASTGSTAALNITVNKPVGAVEGDLLVAAAGTYGDRIMAAPTDWNLVGRSPVQTDGQVPRFHVSAKRATAAEPASYTFTPDGGINLQQVATVMAWMGADTVALPILGAVNTTTQATLGYAWTAPTLAKLTNWGRVLTVAMLRDWAGTPERMAASTTVPLVDTRDVTGDFMQIGIGEEPAMTPVGNAAAKAGTGAYGIWAAGQVMVYPTLQRIRPTADVSAGTWTTAPLWSKLDEVVPDFTDRILGPNAAVTRLTLGAPPATSTDKGHVLRLRARRQNAPTAGSLLVEVLPTGSSTVRASTTAVIPAGDAEIDITLALTEGQAALVRSDVSVDVRLTATVS